MLTLYTKPTSTITTGWPRNDLFASFGSLLDDIQTSISVPFTDVQEDANGWRFSLDLPGYKREEITVEVESGELSIKAANKVRGTIAKTVTLGRDVDMNTVTAALNDGVLTIGVQRLAESRKKKIDVGGA